jgi:acetoin:2,6-dichlorophenolindophenol oxidoreductase subunit beta
MAGSPARGRVAARVGVSEAALITYREAITRALADALKADDDVFLLGEDIAAAGGVFKTTDGLLAEVGPRRVLDTPISEQAIVGTAIGAAALGLRPVAEIMFADFAGVCFDQIANQLAKYRYMSGGQISVPVTIRLAGGAGVGFGAQHSQAVENWFLNIAGLKIVVPSTPADAYGLLRAAVADPDPVLFFEHKALFNTRAVLTVGAAGIELGRADVVRRGTDVTVVATQLMRHRAVEAAERLAGEGISAEIIDPRTLIPFDMATVRGSLDRTNRLVVVQEAQAGGSWGATLIASLVQDHFETLDAPPKLVAAHDTPVPYSAVLEEAWLTSVDRIAAAIRRTVEF